MPRDTDTLTSSISSDTSSASSSAALDITSRSKESSIKNRRKTKPNVIDQQCSFIQATNWTSIWLAAFILFVVIVQFSIYFASLWPYMTKIDDTADQTFYGFTLASYSLAQMLASPCFGYWNSKLKLARPMMAAGLCFAIAGNLVYAFTEASAHNRKWIIMCGRFLGGLGSGAIGTIRAYIATASAPQDRARAIAIGSTALALGVTAGSIIQTCVTSIGYPGFVSGPFHFSEYTAPAYISVVAALISLVLLFTIFKENYTGVDERKNEDPYHYVPKYDSVAAFLCIACWFAIFFCRTNSDTVESPYTMAIFSWTSSDAVFYNGIIMACSSAISFVGYVIVGILGDRMNERVTLIVGMLMLCAFYCVTFPWPFFTGHLTYKSASTVAPATTGIPTLTSTFDTVHSTELYKIAGCDPDMQWCQYTPKLPLPVYLAAYPLLSIGFTVCNVTASTLFAKILGPRRQGLMQSMMIMAGAGARMLGPILISYLFDKYGPRIAWTMTAAIVSICLFAALILYHRLVPLKMRPKLRFGDKLRYDGGTLYHL